MKYFSDIVDIDKLNTLFSASINMAKKSQKETGFSAWMKERGSVYLNEPVIGDESAISRPFGKECRYDFGQGFYEEMDAQIILNLHIHNYHIKEKRASLSIMPSIQDLLMLRKIAAENWILGSELWINPIAVIGSITSDQILMVQIKTELIEGKHEYDFIDYISKTFNSLFEKYYHRKTSKKMSEAMSLDAINFLSSLGYGCIPSFIYCRKRFLDFLNCIAECKIINKGFLKENFNKFLLY